MRVVQPEPMGCGPACLAMLAGVSYERAKEMLGRGRFTSRGLSRKALDTALACAGFAVRRLSGAVPLFADAHLVEVMSTKGRGWHWVVVLRDGTVLDPYEGSPSYIAQTYEAYKPLVRCVAGVYRVGEA